MSKRDRIVEKKSEVKIQNSVSRIVKTNKSHSMNSAVDRILFLQRTVGNQAVQRLIKSTGLLAKLRIGEPGDIYEKEADSVAKQVMTDAQKHGEVVSGRTQGLETYIDSLNGGGMPMPDSLRNFFEPRFGHDFSKVKVHTDAKAAESARSVNARAYTIGQHMVLGEGQYAPETETGKNLLAHELTHVVQQGSAQPNKVKHVNAMPVIQRRLVTFGTLPDVNSLLGLIGPRAGLALNLDVATNQVRIGAVLPAAPPSPTLRARLTTIINHATQHAEVIVGRGQPQVMVGAFPQPEDLRVTRVQQIDIDDLLAIEAGAPGSGVALAAHEIEENFRAHGLRAVAGVGRFRQTHERATELESRVAAELVGPGRRVAEVIQATSPTTQTIVFDYENYYLVFTTRLDVATQNQTVTSSRRAPPVVVSTRIIDNFASGSSAMPAGGAAAIAAATADVAANPTSTVLIEGFADAGGSAAVNQQVSRRRAERVRDALGLRGRVHIEGRGATNFVAANDTPANRALNRRVVITVRRPGP
jgi:outer membrane protein OmpA-like peptidoglycan-associated protein